MTDAILLAYPTKGQVMYIGVGTVNVSAIVEVHGDTAMECVTDPSGGLELTLGGDPSATVCCTARGAVKLVETLLAAYSQPGDDEDCAGSDNDLIAGGPPVTGAGA